MAKRLALLLFLLASAALAQTKSSLYERVYASSSAAGPQAQIGDMYYTSDTAGTILPIRFLDNKCLGGDGSGIPKWVTCGTLTGSGAAGAVTYWTSATNLSGDAVNFFWDATNKRLCIRCSSPSYTLHVKDSFSGVGGDFLVAENIGAGGSPGDAAITAKSDAVSGAYGAARVSVLATREWIIESTRSTDSLQPGSLTFCDHTADSTCVAGGRRWRVDSSGSTFLYGGLHVGTGGTSTNMDANLQSDGMFGGQGRLSQFAQTGSTKDGLNLMSSQSSGGATQWWNWGATSANVWRIQPNGTTAASNTFPANNTGLNIDSSGHISINAAINASYDDYSATKATKGLTLLGATSGLITLGIAATGGDGTLYNLPVSAPSGSNTLLSCATPSGGTSTCTFVAIGASGISGTTSATFVPYSSGGNTLSDSTMSWDSTNKILTTGTGGITFKGATSGGPTFKSPATGGSVTFTLPSADGSSNQCLATDGSTTLSFINCGGGSLPSDPLTTKGDIWGRGTSVDTRIPVGADGQILKADSTATPGVSYAGGLVQIARVITASNATTITFSSIPGDYQDLKITFYGRDANTGTTAIGVYMKLNSDATAANYDSSFYSGNSTSGTVVSTTNGAWVFNTVPVGNNANAVGSAEVNIICYACTSFRHPFQNQFGDRFQTSDGSRESYTVSGLWRSTSAITSIVLTTNGTNFVDGTTAILYGVGTSH